MSAGICIGRARDVQPGGGPAGKCRQRYTLSNGAAHLPRRVPGVLARGVSRTADPGVLAGRGRGITGKTVPRLPQSVAQFPEST